jgi:selenocysteine lyase/cysteine desulfurase
VVAQIISADPAEIALISSASVGVGLIAASLVEGLEVVVPDDEFTSVLYPLLVAEAERGVRVRRVPFHELAEHIGPGTGLVACSVTRSQDGETAALADIVSASRQHGAKLLVDATHAVPFVPLPTWLADIDYLVCHGYKHLLAPRGVAFLYVRRDRWSEVQPWFANWRGGSPLYANSYGGSLDELAPNASRFDLSLAWHAWVGAEASLKLIVEWQRGGLLGEVIELAQRLAMVLGRPAPSASIVSVPVPDAPAVKAKLAAEGIRCAATTPTTVRLSPHVYNTMAEVDRAAELLSPFLQ